MGNGGGCCPIDPGSNPRGIVLVRTLHSMHVCVSHEFRLFSLLNGIEPRVHNNGSVASSNAVKLSDRRGTGGAVGNGGASTSGSEKRKCC